MENNRAKKLAKNTIILTISNFSSKLLSFIFVPLYTYILTTEEYGTSDIITTTVSLVTPIFTILVSEAIMRFSLDAEQDKKQLFSTVVYVFTVGTLLLSVITLGVSFFVSSIRQYIVLFLLYYVSINANEILVQFGKGLEKITLVGVAGVIASVVLITCNLVFLAVFGWGIKGYLLSYIMSHVISSLFLALTLKANKFILPYKKVKRDTLKAIYKYTLPMIPNSISWWVSNSSNKYIITFFLGAGFTGIYSAAHKIPSLLSVVVSIFMSAWQISAVEGFGTKECNDFFDKIYEFFFKALVTVCAGVILFSEFLGDFLFLNEFKGAWVYSPILLLSALFHALSGFMGTIYTSAKKTKFLFYSTVVGAVLNVVLNLILIRFLGVFGAAIATTASYFVIWILRIIDSRKIMKLNVNYFNFVFQTVLLIIEATVISAQIKYNIAISFIITAILLVINFRTLLTNIRDFLTRRNKER